MNPLNYSDVNSEDIFNNCRSRQNYTTWPINVLCEKTKKLITHYNAVIQDFDLASFEENNQCREGWEELTAV